MNSMLMILNEQRNIAEVSKNMFCLDKVTLDKIDSKASCINKRYVCPQVTSKNTILEMGISIVGIKQILVSLGFDAFEVEDVLDKYDKDSIMYVKKESGKNSSYISRKELKRVLTHMLMLLDPNEQITNVGVLMATVYQLCIEKVGYIQSRVDKEVKTRDIKSECMEIVSKYNIFNNKLYGNQQYLIRKEVCEKLNVNMPFSRCMQELGLKYRWVGNEPYFKTHGKEWLVCEIDN